MMGTASRQTGLPPECAAIPVTSDQGADNLAKVGRWNDGPAKTQGPVCRGAGTASFRANVMQTEPCERAAPFAVARSRRLSGLIQSGLLRFAPVCSGLAWVRRVWKVPGRPASTRATSTEETPKASARGRRCMSAETASNHAAAGDRGMAVRSQSNALTRRH